MTGAAGEVRPLSVRALSGLSVRALSSPCGLSLGRRALSGRIHTGTRAHAHGAALLVFKPPVWYFKVHFEIPMMRPASTGGR